MPSLRQLSRAALAALALAACSSASRVSTTPAAAEPILAGVALGSAGGLPRDAALAATLADIDPARIRRTDSTLVAFGTRHTVSDTLSATRGVGAARRWIHAELSRVSADCGGCLRVEYDPGMVAVTRHPDK